MVQINLIMYDLCRTAQVIQLGVDPYKTCSIVGCLSDRLYNISLNCSIIINQH